MEATAAGGLTPGRPSNPGEQEVGTAQPSPLPRAQKDG